MKTKFTLTFRVVIMLLMAGVFTLQVVQVQAQLDSTSADGTLETVRSGNDILQAHNVIFSYSNGPYTSNGLVLNGVMLPLLNSGWIKNNGEHGKDNPNYYCGYRENSNLYYRNFQAFDLSQSNLNAHGITTPITSAGLKVRQYVSEPTTGTQMWELRSVTTAYSIINQNYTAGSPNGIAIYNDFGSGTSYGSVMVDKTLSGTNILSITLNAAAITDINNAIGSEFVIGGEADDAPAPFVPITNWAIVLGIFLITGFIVFRYRRKLA